MPTTWPGRILALAATVAELDGRIFRQGQDLDAVDFPYVTVLSPVARVPALRGDASTLARFHDFQVDVWQRPPGGDQVVDALEAALDGATIDGWRLAVLLVVNVPEGSGNTGEAAAGHVEHASLTVRAARAV